MEKIKEVFNKICKQTDMLGILIILLMFNIAFINEILINYSLKYKLLPFITILIFLKFLQEYIYLYIPVYYIIKSIDKGKNNKTRIYQTLFISLILKNTIKLNYIIILINIYILIKMFLKKYPTKKDITKVNKLIIISIIIYIVAYIITYTQEYSKYKLGYLHIISASIVGGLILINIFNHYRYKKNLKLNENKTNKNECNINERNILVQFIPLILFLTNSLTTPGFITIIICLISTIYIFIKSNTKQRILLLSLWLLQPIINNEEFFTIFSKPKVMSDYVAINIILTYIFMKLYLKKKVEIVSVTTLILTVINIISSIYYIFSNQYLFGYGFNEYIYINIVLLIITILNYYENKKYNIKFGKIVQKISEHGNKLYKFAVDNLPAIIVFILIVVENSLINIPYIKSTFSTGICLIGIVLIYLLEHPIGLLIYLTTFVLVNTGYSIFDSSIIMKIIINMLLLFTFVYLIIKTYFRKNVKKTYILSLIMLISLKNLKITNEFFYKINEISNNIIPFTLILVAILNMYEQIKYRNRNKNKKKKVVFGINSLKIGGAERALVDLVKKIYNAYDVTIYTIYGNGTFEKELEKLVLDKKITLKTIFKKKPKNALVKKIQMYVIQIFYPYIYAVDIQNIYDVEIAFVEGIMTKMFALKSRAKKIAWVHFGASSILNKQKDSVKIRNYTVLKRDIDRITYLKYNDIIFVSNTAKENFLKEFGDKIEDKVSMYVIYKYLDIKRIKELSEEYIPQEITPTITSIVTVAKIIPEKGIDRLLDVHERLIKDGFIHNIYVIGDGIDRERLINETKKRKLKHSFRLVGEISNPYPYIKAGNYFALLSKVEGYGIVIDEAKVLRKEILITKTASIEAVQKYSNIHIFENTEEDIYNGIKKVLGTKEKNKKNKREIVNNLHIFERVNDSKIYDIINIINK